ncbi:MAG: hypothetical protein ABJC74_02045 [Gemmatimonadota bacterium]
MTGHVFHPGHSALHGTTVVLDTRKGMTYVGRFHEETAGGMLLHDAAGFDSASGNSRDDFLRKTAKFGVRIDHKHIMVPTEEVASLVPFNEMKI